jgi:hypothetical protein
MKKILFLLLCSVVMYGQVPADATPLENIQVTNNTTDNTATKVVVQSASNVLNTIAKNDLIDVVIVNTTAELTAGIGNTSKLYATRDNTIIYRFNGTIYVPLGSDLSGKENSANKQNSLAVDGTGVKFPTVDAVRTHTTDTNNPHAVTKAQVGLANVDNTSDLNKPISTATQTALNAKQNTISGTTNVIPKFGTGGVVASNITDNGSLVSTSTDMMVNGINFGRGGGNLSNNVALGVAVLGSNTTGVTNVGIGFAALAGNITGTANTAIGGSYAMVSNVSGSENIAIGSNTLQSTTAGSFNVAVGQFAGSFFAGLNALTSANSSVFIGNMAKANGNGQSNQIVIGFDATGLGSNTTVIGNTSTSFGRWFGRLLLGTSTDNGVDALQTPSTISHAPAVTANQGVVKSQLDLKAPLNSPTFTGTVTIDNLAGSGTRALVADANGTLSTVASVDSRPYKVYTALLNQTGTNAPVATVLENTLGVATVWTRFGVGQYICTSNAFIAGKTTVQITRTNPTIPDFSINMGGQFSGTNTVGITTFNTTGYLDGQLTSATIEIRVYN